MMLIDAYLGLGGNIGDTKAILNRATEALNTTPGIFCVEVSPYYQTTPVSTIPQDNYINAVCHIKTSLPAKELLSSLQAIETTLGKRQKAKNAPRLIDIDILFYGQEKFKDEELEIPHPRWQERLFVLIPLADLVDVICVPTERGVESINLKEYLRNFTNSNHEIVSRMD